MRVKLNFSSMLVLPSRDSIKYYPHWGWGLLWYDPKAGTSGAISSFFCTPWQTKTTLMDAVMGSQRLIGYRWKWQVKWWSVWMSSAALILSFTQLLYFPWISWVQSTTSACLLAQQSSNIQLVHEAPLLFCFIIRLLLQLCPHDSV